MVPASNADVSHAIDQFLAHPVWRDTPLERLIPLGETARFARYGPDAVLFKQFHPADQFSLLVAGAVAHETSEDAEIDAWPMGQVDWPWAALGWSGFLTPNRNGTMARTQSEVALLTWRHQDLKRVFYADPRLAIDFLRLVLDSMRRQFESIRAERSRAQTARGIPPSPAGAIAAGSARGPAAGLLATLRRSAFFEIFADDSLERVAGHARLVRLGAGQEVFRQGKTLDGLWVLAAGNAVSCFMAEGPKGERLERFRSISADGAIVAGLPAIDGTYRAEATVLTESPCRLYEIPADALAAIIRADPEFGRSFMQRHLARLAHLMTAARIPRPSAGEETEISAVKSMLLQNQARIPVDSKLYQLPHLLSHHLTVGHALACLGTVAEAGRYAERAVARSCRDLLSGWQREQDFYRDVLTAYRTVVDAAPDTAAETLRRRCDKQLDRAFDHLDTEIQGIANLPDEPGHIVIMNHLACPPYYKLPNNDHFSFDTAFASVLLSARYGRPPVRVVRQSPGAEYGHNLFYSRLGHITVPTVESGLEPESHEELDRLRRTAGELLFERGREALAAGLNVLVCPEGKSQRDADSPARLFSGAFRLAFKAKREPLIVPIAVAGFERRYKNSKLVAVVQAPFRLSEALREFGSDDLRAFLDAYRLRFRRAVVEARRISAGGSRGSGVARVKAARPERSSAPLPQ
jgi:CRP-like cAMP-binding protein/1-acyl-sn-glycerol-3-phosphate acyltransferase